jgi:hypothetical protein
MKPLYIYLNLAETLENKTLSYEIWNMLEH